jgi:predicted ribosome quality control (RQC) complex YloA/Tae2 family protein
VQIIDRLSTFSYLSSAKRVDENIIKIAFDKKYECFFDMTKSSSCIYKKDDGFEYKKFSSAFDFFLTKHTKNAKIVSLKTLESNKIVEFVLETKASYKKETLHIYFEFTGRHTNIIITDENIIIKEALRHIHKNISKREIKPNIKMQILEPMDFKAKHQKIEDIDSHLYDVEKDIRTKTVASLKKQKLLRLGKQITKIKQNLESLQSQEELLKEANTINLWAQTILENITHINLYNRKITLTNHANQEIEIEVPSHAKTPSHAANILFKKSKRLKQKCEHIHIQHQHLLSKLEFNKKIFAIIDKSSSTERINFYLPSNKMTKKRGKKEDNYKKFFYNGFKIALGRNEEENATLLKESKKDDIWFHIKDLPSAHVVIQTNKKSVPEDVLKTASSVCVEFSKTSKGFYLVDYTKRSNVKVVKKSNVIYTNHKTIKVYKE